MIDPEVEAVGWDAITDAFERVYGEQASWHIASAPGVAWGGPFQGISGYRADGHWHAVTYALTELWVKESDDLERSGLGFELTVRVPATPPQRTVWERVTGRHPDVADRPPEWLPSVLGFVCGWLLHSRTLVEDGHFFVLPKHMTRRGWARPWPGLAFLLDPVLGAIDTPHGRVEFLQLVSLSQESMDELMPQRRGEPDRVRRRVYELAQADHPDDPLYVSPATLRTRKRAL